MRLLLGGQPIAVEVHGEGRPLVLLHGLAMDRRVLVASCEAVFEGRPGWRRLYLDLPGHGESPWDGQVAGADALVDLLGAALAELCPEGALALFGYSYGGYLAQGLLGELGPRLAGLFLLCPTVEPDFARRTLPPRRVARRDEALTFSVEPREQPEFEEVAVVQTQALLDEFRRIVHPGNLAADHAMMGATRARYALSRPYFAALGEVASPVSIACGRDDHWVGFVDAFRLARTFPRAAYHVLPDCGQLLPLEQPARFRALFADWLDRVEAEAT